MPTDAPEQDDDQTAIPESNAFLSYIKRLESGSEHFQKLLNETEDDIRSLTPRITQAPETSKSVEEFQMKKIKFLREIEDEEKSDLKILEQLAAENPLPQHSGTVSVQSDTTSVLSYITFTADDDDPLQWNVEDFGAPTAKAEQMAYQDLAALIEDQEQQDGRWSTRPSENDSKFRPTSARFQNASDENRLFYERHSKPVLLENDNVPSGESDDVATSWDTATIGEIEQEMLRLKSEVAEQGRQAAEAEKFRKNKAATIIQATFRGYRVRLKHGTRVKRLIAEAKKRFFDERVRKIEADRQRLIEMKRAEEMERKAAEMEQRRKEEEEEKRIAEEKQAELERVRLAREAEEQRKIAEQLAAEKVRQESEAEKAKQKRLIFEAAEKKKMEEAALKQADEQRKIAEQLAAEKTRQETAEKQIKDATERKKSDKHKQEETGQKSHENEKAVENVLKHGEEKDSEKIRHFPDNPPAGNFQHSSKSRAGDHSVRSSVERPRSRMKEEQRKMSDDSYNWAKSSFEESQKEFTREDSKPEILRPKSSEKRATESLRKSVASEGNNEVRRSFQKKKSENQKPHFQIDSQKLKSVQMTWVKDCHSWSETVAQLKVSSTRIVVRQTSSTSRNAIRPPPDCKAVPTSDLLLRALGRSHPPPAAITSLTLSGLQSQFDLSCLATLTNLTCLDISNSNFTYLCNLDKCTRLSYLNASHNKIKDVDVNRLEALSFLDLSYNELTSLSGISNSINLLSLSVSYNRLVRLNLTISPNIFFMRLHSLDLSHNQLLSTREWLTSMPSLISLDLSSNNLRAVDGFASLGLLQFLNVSYNSLSEIPDLSNCPLLVDADFSGNNLHAVDSISKYFLPHLLRLNLSRNMLTLVPDISNLFNLIEIRLENNQLIAYDALMKNSRLLQMARLKFIRGDFLCFNSEDSGRLNDELRTRRGVELISADYDDAITLCSTLKLLISSGLVEDEEEGNERIEPEDEFLEFSRFLVLLQDNLNNQLGALAEENKAALSDNKRKAAATNLMVENRWNLLRTYFEESSKGALERRYAVEFCGIQGGTKKQEAPSKPATVSSNEPSATVTSVSSVTQNTNTLKLDNNSREQVNKISKTVEAKPNKLASEVEKQQEIKKQKEAELKRREAAAICIQSNWRGFLARFEVARWHVAATYIQKAWRGYWVRKQIKAVLEQFVNEPSSVAGNQNETVMEEDFENEFNDKSVDDLMSFLSSIQSTTESINLTARPGSRGFDKDAAHRIAWISPSPRNHGGGTEHENMRRSQHDILDDGATNTDSPLPGSLAESAVPPVNFGGSSSRTPSKKVQHIQEEWGFADPTTVELMIKRANRMKQAEKRKKMGKLDANQRLALARKQAVLETSRSPAAATHQHASADVTTRDQYPTHDIRMGAPIVSTGRSSSPSESVASSTRQNQTFAWLHSAIREPSPLPPAGGIVGTFPPITTGGFMSNYTGTGAVSNRSASNEHRRRFDDVPTFPPITPSSKPSSAASNSNNPQPHRQQANQAQRPKIPAPVQVSEEKPKKRDLIRAWREPAVRLSGGWGGGRSTRKK